MKYLFRVGAVFGALMLSALLVGCAEDNEASANITGRPPADGGPKTQTDTKTLGGGAALPKNYPGNARRR